MRDGLLRSDEPTLTPTIVTLIEPDDATLAIFGLLGSTAFIVSDAVKLLAREPVVMTVRRCGQTPVDERATIELSDRHFVIADGVPPTRDGLV